MVVVLQFPLDLVNTFAKTNISHQSRRLLSYTEYISRERNPVAQAGSESKGVSAVGKRIGWRLGRWVLVGALGACLAAVVYRVAPRPVSEGIPAVQFRLGANHHIRQVTVAIHGSWRYTIFGYRRFHGTIGIYGPGEDNPYDYKHRTLTMTVYPFAGGWVLWEGSNADQPFLLSYGSLYASRDFRRIRLPRLVCFLTTKLTDILHFDNR